MVFGSKKIDCKSVIGILSLGAKGGTELLLQADGPDAEAAVSEIGQLFDNNFGE
jgi:phosphocarrier protein NPr/phosphocarrier protein